MLLKPGRYVTTTREMLPVKRMEQIEDVLRFVKNSKLVNLTGKLESKIKGLLLKSKISMSVFRDLEESEQASSDYHQAEVNDLCARSTIQNPSPAVKCLNKLQSAICQMHNLRHILSSSATSGGTKNSMHIIKLIESQTKRISTGFIDYNQRFRHNLEPYTLESIEVKNKEKGTFWKDDGIHIFNDESKILVIDAWNSVVRNREAIEYFWRDLRNIKLHLANDIILLQSQLIAEGLDINAENGMRIMIIKRVHALKLDLKLLEESDLLKQ